MRLCACSIVVLAGDTLPIDVYCHLPIMCEDRNLPYAYIPSKVVSVQTEDVVFFCVIFHKWVSGYVWSNEPLFSSTFLLRVAGSGIVCGLQAADLCHPDQTT